MLARRVLLLMESRKAASVAMTKIRANSSNGSSLQNRHFSAAASNPENGGGATVEGSSVDKEEMKRFKQLANNWWIENGEFEALHRMNAIRVPLIRDTMVSYRDSLPLNEKQKLKSYLDDKNQTLTYTDEELEREPLLGLNLLDIGCGGGILSEPLARLGAQVTAVDSLKENIIVAQLRAQAQSASGLSHVHFYDRLRYINCAVEDLAVVEENWGYFDGVVMSEVVEHVNNLDEFMKNSIKLLKNKGFVFITTINKTPQSYALAIVAAEYLLNLVPRGTHSWDKFVKPEDLSSILEKNETSVKFEMGMFYNPLTKNWSWSRDKSVNYGMTAQKFSTSSSEPNTASSSTSTSADTNKSS